MGAYFLFSSALLFHWNGVRAVMHAQHAQRVWRPPGIHLAFIDRLMIPQQMTIRGRERAMALAVLFPRQGKRPARPMVVGFDSFA
jgi:hypothetical protein